MVEVVKARLDCAGLLFCNFNNFALLVAQVSQNFFAASSFLIASLSKVLPSTLCQSCPRKFVSLLKSCFNAPVFFRFEFLDFSFAFDYQSHGHGLDAAGRESASTFFQRKGRVRNRPDGRARGGLAGHLPNAIQLRGFSRLR
jgi:hypothetical protein